MKKALIVVAVVIVLIVAGIFFIISRLDSLIAQAIERGGSKATQTEVTVSGVDISLRDGTGAIDGFVVANPEGFNSPNAFSLENITLELDIESLRSEVIGINAIRIAQPVVYAEITDKGVTNIDVLKRRVEEFAGGSSGGGEDGAAEQKRIRIGEFVFEKGRIELDASALGMEKKTIDLPEIRLSDIGGEEGLLPSEISGYILAEFSKRITSEIARSGIEGEIKGKIGGAVEEKAKGLLDKVGN